jgi:predicted Co/Zn/Cd cation transporter (cation efflux family)
MAAATPLVIAIQAFVLLATLLYAAVEAVSAIRRRRGRRGVVR